MLKQSSFACKLSYNKNAGKHFFHPFVISNEESGARALALSFNKKDPSKLVVALRGSNCLALLMRFVKQSDPIEHTNDSLCHRGAVELFNSVENELTIFLNSKSLSTSITFCGHSFGGGVALIASGHYAKMYPNKEISCHTFGSIRVGDDKFNDFLESCVPKRIHVISRMDLVPHIPLIFPDYRVANRGDTQYTSTRCFSPIHAHRIRTYFKSSIDKDHHSSKKVL